MIFLSAGHYPSRPGACYGDFCEHREAVRWVVEIASHFDDGLVLVPTGTLKEKVDFINRFQTTDKQSFCVEIHFNSAMAGGVNVGTGAECLYTPFSVKSERIAEVIQKSIVEDVNIRDRGIKEGYYRLNKLNGVDFFLSKTLFPAVIIEPEFIHHISKIEGMMVDTCERIAVALKSLNSELNG